MDPNSSIGRGIIISDAADVVLLNCIGAGPADCPNADTRIGVTIGAVRDPTFDEDNIPTDDTGQWVRGTRALRGDPDRIDLVHGASGWVTDEIVFDQQPREHSGSRAMNGYRAGRCGDVVVLYGQIVGRRPGSDGGGNIANQRRRRDGHTRCATAT